MYFLIIIYSTLSQLSIIIAILCLGRSVLIIYALFKFVWAGNIIHNMAYINTKISTLFVGVTCFKLLVNFVPFLFVLVFPSFTHYHPQLFSSFIIFETNFPNPVMIKTRSLP